jgi:hypothetical protein
VITKHLCHFVCIFSIIKSGPLSFTRVRPRPSPPSPRHPDEVGADIISESLWLSLGGNLPVVEILRLTLLGSSSHARGGRGLGGEQVMLTRMQTTRLITCVIVGLVVFANLLYWFGPATLRTEELVVIGLSIIGLISFQVWLRRRGA